MNTSSVARTLSLAALAFGFLTAGQVQLLAKISVNEVVADIPFSFTVDNTQFPAGKYVIVKLDTADGLAMEIRADNATSRPATAFLVQEDVENSVPTQTELEFTKYGDREFLSKILVEGDTNGVQLVQSRTERKLKKDGQTSHKHRLSASARSSRKHH